MGPNMRRSIDRREFLEKAAMLAGGTVAAEALGDSTDRAHKRQGLTDLTAVAAVTAMRSGEMKAEDYARALLDRAQHLVSLNAFRTLDREMVLEAARAADKFRASGAALGALHGLPIPVKDSINSKCDAKRS
jgi:indoleacetamide hydrolase